MTEPAPNPSAPLRKNISESLFTSSHHYFPLSSREIPFGNMINGIFFEPRSDNRDYSIHGPNVIRLCAALLESNLHETGLIKGTLGSTRLKFNQHVNRIQQCIGFTDTIETTKTRELLQAAALYHDIGKSIRRANHPLIGANLVRNFDEAESRKLVELLVHPHEPRDTPSRFNRFSLITSIIQHHDKFGVVSTGEGGLPLFGDILFFASGQNQLAGVKKNVTAVMLLNLADIAAVCVAPQEDKEKALKIGTEIAKARGGNASTTEEAELLNELASIVVKNSSCLGLTFTKVSSVLEDWAILVDSIEHPTVLGNRVELKRKLVEVERNPSRAIERILRLLDEAVETSGANVLTGHFSRASVESILVGTLGAHQFQTFCAQLACVAKLDYALNFFKAVACATIRSAIGSKKMEDWQPDRDYAGLVHAEMDTLRSKSERERDEISSAITSKFVMVLQGLVTRYAGVLDASSPNPRRFGFQLRDLTSDAEIREAIIDLLCIKPGKEAIALTWIEDEVSIWSMD